MKFRQKLRANGKDSVWREYCGFLDLSLSDYMYIQNRLMTEQLKLWCASGLGQGLLHGEKPQTVEEFRRVAPLTSYADYADALLAKRGELLPAESVLWLETTWEGGLRPTKLAPYSREMIEAYTNHAIAVTMIASCREAGDFSLRDGDRMLYGGAPLPYATGILPLLLDENVSLRWLPDNDASELSFSQRIKKGFTMAMNGGIDFFFAIGSVANYITENFSSASSGGSRSKGAPRRKVSPKIALRYLKAKYVCRRDGRALTPGDVFHIKGMVCTGTDANCYKASLAKAWGVAPVEMAAGTESTCLGVETWEQNGMVFFPDSCFYEFIPEAEMLRSLSDPAYTPRTCLMDEIRVGERYELVISVLHGGAFMRYRIGDMYRCVAAPKGSVPHLTFVDRVPTVIDIAGFTRLTEATVSETIRLSKLGIGEWLARKEYSESGVPFLHMYIEILPEAQQNDATEKQILTDQLAAYFRYFDSDYADLKKLLGMEPLQVDILKYGVIDGYRRASGREVRRICPSDMDVAEILACQKAGGERR